MSLSQEELSTPLRVIDIVTGTTVDGPGFRTSIYFAGCTHHCPGCHNPSTWSPDAGEDITIGEIMAKIVREGWNVTFSGGDPMMQAGPLRLLARAIKELGLTIWCYTGYSYESLDDHSEMRELLDYIDVLVDGPFIESQRDTSLLFRGSANQRLIDVNRSRKGTVALWQPDF